MVACSSGVAACALMLLVCALVVTLGGPPWRPRLSWDPSVCVHPLAWGHGEATWTVCGDGGLGGVVYSFGINDDWSFDDAAAGHGCEVHGFDPSVAVLSAYEEFKGKKFHHAGIGGEDKDHPPGTVPLNWPGMDYLRQHNKELWVLRTVGSFMKELKHSSVEILKIDVEGEEWAALPQMLQAGDFREGRIKQFLLEVHMDPSASPSRRRFYQSTLTQLQDQHMVLWHAHLNGNNCMELSFKWTTNHTTTFKPLIYSKLS
eukprot:NODE_1427_length_960_cov_300.273326_g1103_i0.p1 GENE.NODE_1427_length_960_cov_300.273326_g1103_i0~~NODE_1427_length_960_cov_300.273326_g1103_i0.p1  ORF type:complete len:259 (-),score=47.88 NODE_1427_length_960_cov_300.273326_g1103_i0:132-908(-)